MLSSVPSDKWVGTIETLSSTSDGHGILTLRLAPHLTVATWNNGLSDIADRTLLDPASTLYRTLTHMRQGEPVFFAGSFHDGDADCLRENSMTQERSMTDPEFLFTFTDVRPFFKGALE